MLKCECKSTDFLHSLQKIPALFSIFFLTKGPDSGQKWPIEHCNPRVYSNIKIFILFSPQTGRLPSLYPNCTPRRRQSVGRNPIRTGLSPGATGLRPGKTGLRRVPAIIKRSKFITRPSSFKFKGQGGQTFERDVLQGRPCTKNIKETTKRKRGSILSVGGFPVSFTSVFLSITSIVCRQKKHFLPFRQSCGTYC